MAQGYGGDPRSRPQAPRPCAPVAPWLRRPPPHLRSGRPSSASHTCHHFLTLPQKPWAQRAHHCLLETFPGSQVPLQLPGWA